MNIAELFSKLRQTEKFKDWQGKNPDAKPVHVFMMLEPGADVQFDIGFYDSDKKLMTSFVTNESFGNVSVNESKEIFAKDQQSIKPLDEEKVKLSFKDAFEISHKLQKEKYRQHEPIKEVVILQNLDVGQVWNITYITKTFETLNIKVDAENGKVVEDGLHKIFSFGK
jgi:hypothetical protein